MLKNPLFLVLFFIFFVNVSAQEERVEADRFHQAFQTRGADDSA